MVPKRQSRSTPLNARASLNFRGRQRYDAVAYGNYEGENQHDLGKLVVLVRMSVANDDGDTDFTVIEPYFDVCDLPKRPSYKTRRDRVKKTVGPSSSRLTDGRTRLGRRYVALREEATHAYKLEPIRNIVRPTHLVPDPLSPLCLYVQDSTVYYA